MGRFIRPLPNEITRALFAAGGRRLVLVEGSDDKGVFDIWFEDRLAGISFYATNGCEDVHQFLPQALDIAIHRRIYGIIDRDYRDDAEAMAWKGESDPHLFILPRHELENYLLDPQALQAELRVLYAARAKPPSIPEITRFLLDVCVQLMPVIAVNWILREQMPEEAVLSHTYPLARADRAFLIQHLSKRMACATDEAEQLIAEKEAAILPLLQSLDQAHTRIKGKHLFFQTHQKYCPRSVISEELLRNRMAERILQTVGVPSDITEIIERILAAS